jgi:ribosomal protein S16
MLVTLGLALLLVAPGALAQEATLETQASSNGESLQDASPLEPGDPITVTANVSTTGDADREWRVFLNATVEGASNTSVEETWTGEQTVEVDAQLTAPDEEGPHALAWTVLVQSRTSDGAWTNETQTEEREGFEVRKPAPPPSEEDVEVDVTARDGQSISELGTLNPNEQVILDAEITLPERERTEWNVSASVTINGTQVAEAQQQRSQSGTFSFPLQATAPSEEGDVDLAWEVVVEYRDSGEDTWNEVTTRSEQATVAVEQPTVEPGPGIPWLWILVGAAVLVGGGAGAYYLFKPPEQIKGEPRSQALQDLEGEDAAAAETDEPEVHPQVKILEARAEDLRRMIELARERHEEGEITEHQFEQIKERKEAELEEVEEEIEDYRQESGQ